MTGPELSEQELAALETGNNLSVSDSILFTDDDVRTIAYNLSTISGASGRLEILLQHMGQDVKPAKDVMVSVRSIISALGSLQKKLNAAPSSGSSSLSSLGAPLGPLGLGDPE